MWCCCPEPEILLFSSLLGSSSNSMSSFKKCVGRWEVLIFSTIKPWVRKTPSTVLYITFCLIECMVRKEDNIAKTIVFQYSQSEFLLFLYSACSKGNFVNQVKLGDRLNVSGYVSHSFLHPIPSLPISLSKEGKTN